MSACRSPRMFSSLRAAAAISAVLVSSLWAAHAHSQVSSRVETGTLSMGDPKLSKGEYFDRYTIAGTAGQHLQIDLTSSEFDPFLQMHRIDARGLTGDEVAHNDDFEQSRSHSRLDVTLPVTGDYIIFVTSYEGYKTGHYELRITTVSGRVENGKLSPDDSKLNSDEFYDVYRFTAKAGETYVLDLFSSEFDTYLYVRSADPDFKIDNDDHPADPKRSQISMVAPKDGEYSVYVTSHKPGEVGAYRLTINTSSDDVAPDAPRRESGQLRPGDETLKSGEYVDFRTFEGAPGQHVRIELRSSDFDTYVMLIDPRGESRANDDFNGDSSRSVIETDLTEVGTYHVAVTSYKPGETGDYQLLIETDSRSSASPTRDVVHLGASGDRAEQLTDSDFTDADNRFSDRFSFDGNAGDRVIIRMSSGDFDSLLVLTFPDGRTLQFDDFDSQPDAQIDLELPETGRYRVSATSYNQRATGEYVVHFALADSDIAPEAPTTPVIPVARGRRILGVFVGVADYPGEANDLPACDHDAETLYRIFIERFGMRPEDAVLLTNSQATRANVARALEQIGGRARPEDFLIFFYSGHGNQVDGVADHFDPDGVHETMSLYDGDMIDDDFAALVNASPAGLCLVALDSCMSGGFAKDVVCEAGRMGIFSSEEDVLSAVPDKRDRGGYLSMFLADALGSARDLADADHNRDLTAIELSHYLGERYRDEVRTKGGEGHVRIAGDLSYQRLVIDRGGVRYDQVLFKW